MTIEEDIAEMQRHDIETLGRWEIAQVPEPISASFGGGETSLTLTLVVHAESDFILSSHAAPADEKNSATATLVEVIKKHGVFPETLAVKDQALFDELEPIAHALGFNIERTSRFRAIPEVLRAMTRLLSKRP